MSKIVQEKFEVRPPYNPNDDAESGWKSDKSARRSKSEYMTRAVSSLYETYGSGLNDLPPGMDIERQNLADIHAQGMSKGNLGTFDDVTVDVTRESLRQGFDRKQLRPTDDMYTREHNDAFYEDVTVDGVTGFLERNNMLDRE